MKFYTATIGHSKFFCVLLYIKVVHWNINLPVLKLMIPWGISLPVFNLNDRLGH